MREPRHARTRRLKNLVDRAVAAMRMRESRAVDTLAAGMRECSIRDRRMPMRQYGRCATSKTMTTDAQISPLGPFCRTKRHDRSQFSDRVAVVQPVGYPPPPPRAAFHTSSGRSLTDRADRSAGGFAFSIGVAAGYLWRWLRPRSFTGHRNGPGASPFPSRSQNRPPALPVKHIRLVAKPPPYVALWGRLPGAREVQVILKEPHTRAA